MLKLVLPKGSLEKATLTLFEEADLGVSRSSEVDYKASIDDPRVDDVRILRPQEIGTYVTEGLFDLGITGRDWIEETDSDVVSLGELHYSKATARPIKVVLAVADAVIGGLMRVQLDTSVPVFSCVLTPQHFHEHADHVSFFAEHLVGKGREVARACAQTLEAIRALPA